jgi:putative membrane protein
MIVILSILIPVLVFALFGLKLDWKPPVFLPPIYASTNALTALILIAAYLAIKKGNIKLHKRLIHVALLLSTFFLVMYLLHHATSESTKYGGDGILKLVYYVVLISHILLSVAVIPVVLITYARARNKHFQQHKKIAKIAFPLWLYVSISGVVVYLMISPYYV